MKRFYNHILSLLLLMVAGVTGAIAQNIQQGKVLTTVDQVVGQDIFLNSIGQYGTGFAAGTGAYTTTLSNENVSALRQRARPRLMVTPLTTSSM